MIVGVTGTNGAGKGTIVEYLQTKGFAHYSGRMFITEEIERRGLPVDRTSMNLVANDLRKQNGPFYIAGQLFKRAEEKGGDAAIESIRNIGEAKFLKEHGAKLFAIDADKRLRYERAVLRGSTTDKVLFEEFCLQEDREMAQTAEHDMNVFGVMKMADVVFQNNGTLTELHTQIDTALQQIIAGGKT